MTFRRVPPPTVAALERLVRVISERVGRALERQGLLVRDLENPFLTVDSPDGAGFDDLLGHSITYRIALGPHQGRKAFALQTVPAATGPSDGNLARAAGFSLHAGVACEAPEREKLERLRRYISATFAQWSREIPGWVAAVHRDRPCWPHSNSTHKTLDFVKKGGYLSLYAGYSTQQVAILVEG